jgi:hypothetical protein
MLIIDVYGQNAVQRVRIDLETPQGFTRQLLLGFTPDNAATDGFDYGYDALNGDDFPDDFSWIINNDKYVIQGVGAFDTSKIYPIGFFLTNSGNVRIGLNSLENFENDIEVYIYDIIEDSYHFINDTDLNMLMASGDYTDRYFITFSVGLQSNSALSIEESDSSSFSTKYSKDNRELVIKTNDHGNLVKVEIYSLFGQRIFSQSNLNNSILVTRIPEIATGITILQITTSTGILRKKVLL